ncbi:MAG: xyloglucanase [Treponema sp.]|jgi:photosystem II stability/assembly factor-like uncharacterized protein|nr:xyloglucanase [Treponema sp.]
MKKHFIALAAWTRVLLVAVTFISYAACASVPPEAKAPDRELPQYSQKGWKNVKIVGGGFIPGIVYNTSKQGVAYLRTDMGGAYRWNPDNESWIPLTDFAGFADYGRLGIASIATDPVEPNRVIIASGTYTNDWDKTPSQMLVSEDYGDTFTRVDMPFKMGGNMPGRGAGERIAIDPNDNRIVYFGSFGDGLWRSKDYGLTWEEVTSFPAKGNIYDADFAAYQNGFKHFFGIMWVVFDPESGADGRGSQNIYVGVADTRSTIYESMDAGQTWHTLEKQPVRNVLEVEEHAHMLEKCPCKKYYPLKAVYSPEGALLTAWNAGFGPYSSSYQGGGIWKYMFATKEWVDISLPQHDYDPHEPERPLDRGVGSVAVDWQHPNVYVASTLNEWWPDEYLYRSTDGGKTWDALWYLDGYPNRVNKYTLDISMAPWLDWGTQKELPEQNPKLGWMITDIEIDPFNSDVMVYGTGATLYGTKNLTDWDKQKRIRIAVMAEGIEECAILDLVSPTEGEAHLISGMGDIGGFIHKNLNRAPSMLVNPTISGVSSIDYAASKPSYIVRMGDAKVGISRDWGENWMPSEKVIEGANTGWGGKIAVSADAKVIVWSPSNLSAHWSANEGKVWTQCGGLPVGARVVSDRVDPAKFYAFGKPSDGSWTVYLSEDGGRTFSVVNETFIVDSASADAGDFKSVNGREGHLWLAAGKAGLFHSEDGGRNWKQFEHVEDALIIGLGKEAPGAEYQALYTHSTINGVDGFYRSDDKGASWTRINDDAHQFGAANSAITGDPRIYGRVYIGANVRGILYRDVE